mmetsp:Transcript_44595/g.126019  ORF Transcript_44595/g.126019 Transcript_44595/m.126019 type:complete len:1444 (+) Transcript_44595:53-4384(+)
MGSPFAHLALLREVVGPGPPEALLASAWRRSGGDLAAAVNIVLDSPPAPSSAAGFVLRPAQLSAPAPEPSRGGGVVGGGGGGRAPIVLDLDLDDDAEEPVLATVAASSSAPPPRERSPAAAAQAASAENASRRRVAPAEQPPPQHPAKRARTETATLETPPKEFPPAAVPKARPEVEFSFHLGCFEINGYSTKRVPADQRISMPGGELKPLLRRGDRLELRWSVEPKRTRGGKTISTEAVAGREGGTIRFDAHGQEVGKLPAQVAKALVPLLIRRMIDVEVFVGSHPPTSIDLGSNIPLVVHISLYSLALRSPGQLMAAAGVATGVGAAAAAGAANAKAKGQKAFLQLEANREVLQLSTAQLLELLKLPRHRSAVLDDAAAAAAVAGGDDTAGLPKATPAKEVAGGEAGEEEEEEADEMTRAAEAQLGGRAALERSHLPAVELPESLFKSRLRHYQAQAVYWMWLQENPTSKMPAHFLQTLGARDTLPPGRSANGAGAGGREDLDAEPQLHPMWDEFELPVPAACMPGREPARFLYHHRSSGALSLDFPDAALAHCRGGVLADDMGLGKTVMCLALLSLDSAGNLPSARIAAAEHLAFEGAPGPSSKNLSAFLKQGGDDGVGGMLVVAPLSLIRQWAAEVKRHFPPGQAPSVYEYHGTGRHIPPEQLRLYGVVMTTFGTLSNEKDDGPLFKVFWRRVVLDEAHVIKNRISRQAQAAFKLRAFARWCVTGTPLQNSIEEVYSLVRFLRVDPWSAWATWRKAVSIPLEKGRQGSGEALQEALDAVRRILQPLLIRRTKSTLDQTGKPLLELPKKHVHILHLELSPAERDFYDALYKKATTTFNSVVASGQILNQYTQILQLILRLRQALCHPFLVFAREGVQDADLQTMEQRCLRNMTATGTSEKFVTSVLEEIRNGVLSDCPICCDVPQDPTITPCGHIFCRECALKIPNKCGGECPVCRKPGIDRKSLKVLPGASRFPARLMAEALGPEAAGSEGALSTKMKELMSRLRLDMAEGRRVVVFSQWTSFLDLVGNAFEAAKVNWQRFDGSLSLDQRQARVNWLSDPAPEDKGAGPGRTLMVSLKAGGVGLNLVAASRLYLLDLWWNPAVEEQAIQRVHRIGQTQEVHVYKFVVVDSIDEDLLELHKAKERLLEDAMHGGRAQEAASKLTLDDLKRIFNPCRKTLSALRNEGGDVSATGASGSSSPPVAAADPAPMDLDEAPAAVAPPADLRPAAPAVPPSVVPAAASVPPAVAPPRSLAQASPMALSAPLSAPLPALPSPPPSEPLSAPPFASPMRAVPATAAGAAGATGAAWPASAPAPVAAAAHIGVGASNGAGFGLPRPLWDAVGDLFGDEGGVGAGAQRGGDFGGNAGSGGGSGCAGDASANAFFSDDDEDEEELLAACRAMEAQMASQAAGGAGLAAQAPSSDSGAQESAPCWDAMPEDF